MITTLYRLLELLNGIVRRRPSDLPESSRRAARTPPPGVWRRSNTHRRVNHLRGGAGDAGMTTAEYAVGTVAAVAFAVVLFKVVQSSAVHSALTAIVIGALHVRM
jgi:Protein of unknown function (DUF4244)